MISIVSEKDCCGCGACEAVCPRKCIKKEEGSLGHIFVKADEELCSSCGLCDKVCPMKAERKNEYSERKVYAAYAKDEAVRFSGSSGGIFGTFAKELIGEGYVVYGAAFDNEFKLMCTEAKSEEELLPLYKSKYLQSDFSGKYAEIKKRLSDGEKVFVTSTPCQIAAIKAFLGKEYDNLITVDFFCHGVPSQRFFDECRAFDEEKKYKAKILEFSFRAKKKNASTIHCFNAELEKNGKKKRKFAYYFKSTFYAFFQKYINLRESCYDCPLADSHRVSDITIGDFHAVDKYLKGFNRFEGVSIVVINSEKGKKLFEDSGERLYVEEVDLEKCGGVSEFFGGGTPRPERRDEFLRDYEELPIEKLAKKYVPEKSYFKMHVYYSLPRFVREKIRKVFLGE